MKNSCTRLGVLTLAAIISFAGVCAEAGKCVVTYTFDDGLADQYTVAYPMFRKAGLPATFFIIGSRVGDPNGIRNKAESNTPVMSWDQIRDLSTNGMEIASHGWAHAKYAKMNRDEILEDIRRNQVALKENAGVDCVSFASPFNAKKGADGSDVEALAKEAGLRAMRMRQKGAGGKMTAEQMNALVASAQKKGEWLVFMIHGLARGYDAWENPQELEKHLAWVKEQKDVRVLSFADAASQTGECRGLSVGEVAIPQGANVAPNGDRIEVTSKCLRLNGKAIIPLMGEMHYSRVPRSEWAASLKTMKEGGISIVSTYVFWNHHEWKEGAYDFSGNRDLSAFLEEVHKAGMWAVVRIGPWAHGECREGGFPDWLIDKRGKGNGERGTGGMKLRSCDRQFLAEVEKFWTRLSPEVAPHLWKNGGPVIGVQLENESRGPWPYYQALKALAVKAGYDVPMYTRTGWPRLNGPETTFGEMIPLYGDYAEGFWDRELKSMPGSYKDAFRMRPARTSSVIATEQLGAQKAEDAKGAEKYPYFTCELGGGMASSYHRRLKMEPMDAFALAVVKLGSGSNLPGFYMYHGGTNPTDTGASMAESQRGLFTNWNDLPVVSYEFQSPVSEFGEPQSSYWLIQALGRFCREYGEELAVEDPVFVNEHETRRGRFVFHNDYVRRLNPDGACWIGIEKDGKVERVVDAKTILLVPHPCGASCTCACGENLVYGLSDLKLVKPAGTPPPVALGPAGAAMMPEERAWDMAAEYEVPFKPEANMLEIAYAGDMARLYADGRLVQDDFWKGRPIRYALRRLPRGTKRLTLKVLPWGEGAKEKIFIDSVKRHDVKYRGIFVNDEDWGLRPWAVKHFGKKEQIGVRAYEKIFSLMEKDGLNLIWPAMHEGGYEFSSRPENLELARKHGITVGTSHCEPMLRNNCYLSKEDRQKWSWTANRDFLVDYWKEGVRRGTGNGEWGTGNGEEGRGKSDGILWTIGMRGIHDGKMQDGKTTGEKIKILEEVFAAQCAMLPEGAPKLFVPYKEVLPIFNAGLKVPKDATIMWTNDNFGYVRRVGGPQCEGYGGGIYWHASYHGSPHGYIHLCTTPPAFMWYELVAKCWENGVRDVWMVNAGDVFQAEILLDAYGRFAADPESWGPDAQVRFLSSWATTFLSSRVGKSDAGCPKSDVLAKRIAAHLAEYYNLGFNRKPEHMCVQWSRALPESVKSSLLKRYHALLNEDMAIERLLHDSTRSTRSTRLKIADEYFRLVGFQVRFLASAGIIHLEGRDKEYARSVIDPLYERWDKLDNGKWSGFWCDTIDERGGKRQPTAHNRWSSQMQWPWNEPADPYATKDRGVARADYPATAYRADVAEPEWLEPVANTPASGGAWTRVEGLGTSGRALALLPVKPGVGKGAAVEYDLVECCHCGNAANTNTDSQLGTGNIGIGNTGNIGNTLVLQFLPDFALWPGLKLGVSVSFDDGAAHYVAVPKSDANIGEHDPVRNRAVQDNFIRVGVPVPEGARRARIAAVDPGVVIDRIGLQKLF